MFYLGQAIHLEVFQFGVSSSGAKNQLLFKEVNSTIHFRIFVNKWVAMDYFPTNWRKHSPLSNHIEKESLFGFLSRKADMSVLHDKDILNHSNIFQERAPAQRHYNLILCDPHNGVTVQCMCLWPLENKLQEKIYI